MKTAMQQLIEKIETAIRENKKPYGDASLNQERLFVYKLIKTSATQLLELEKNQIVDAFNAGVSSAAHRINDGDKNVRRKTTGEFIELWTDFDQREYYNKTFKK